MRIGRLTITARLDRRWPRFDWTCPKCGPVNVIVYTCNKCGANLSLVTRKGRVVKEGRK